MKKHFFLSIALVLFLFSCQKENQELSTQDLSSASLGAIPAEDISNPDEAIFLQNRPIASESEGSYIYTESNDKNLNKILIYKQNDNGGLKLWKEISSGGKGTGAGLGSQGAVCISKDHEWLFAVNAGSNSFSVFNLHKDGDLTLKATVGSLGEKPSSITSYGNIVYVLNNGSSTISGFAYFNGSYTKTAGSPHNLSSSDADAPQIRFQPDGNGVVVTEKKTNIIDVFKLNTSGDIISVVHNQSQGVTPFGFDYGSNNKYLVISNAANGFSGAGSCTSYKESGQGYLENINGAVSDFQTSPCWVATTKHGSFAFTTNAGTNAISSFSVDKTGSLTLISSVAAKAGINPIDIVVSEDNVYVYNINSMSHTISQYKRQPGGKLKAFGNVPVSNFAAGLASY